MSACVTGGTGFLGAHVVRALAESGEAPRVTYRNEARLTRLEGVEHHPVPADVFDRAALRRAFKGCDTVFHVAGHVGSRPRDLAFRLNALAPRLVVEAAAAEGVGRVVVTSSVAGLGPVAGDGVGTEDDPYRGGGLDLVYPDSKHEGQLEALAAGARLGIEVVVVCPSYVLGAPVDRSQPGETSTRVIGNYLRGRLPAVVDGRSDFVDVRDVARGHLLAAEKGVPGEAYVLGGTHGSWVELIETTAAVSGVHHPVAILTGGLGDVVRAAEAAHLPVAMPSEAIDLMAANWCYSSAKARKALGYRARGLEEVVESTVDWYRELIESGTLSTHLSPLAAGAAGMRIAERVGALGLVQAVGRRAGRRLVTRA